VTDVPNPLARLESAVQLLAEMEEIDDVKLIRDQAEAMRIYARERDLGIEAQNHAAEIRIRAERRMGELLLRMPKNHGARGVYPPSTDTTAPTLSDLGLSRDQASRCQRIARIPEDAFESHLARMRATGREVSAKSLLRLAVKLGAEKPAPTTEHVGQLMRAQRLRAELRAVRSQMLGLDPTMIGGLRPRDIEALRMFMRDVRDWLDRLDTELRQPPRLVRDQPSADEGDCRSA